MGCKQGVVLGGDLFRRFDLYSSSSCVSRLLELPDNILGKVTFVHQAQDASRPKDTAFKLIRGILSLKSSGRFAGVNTFSSGTDEIKPEASVTRSDVPFERSSVTTVIRLH
ncbi:hypothetical protein BaRGS_00026502 [Batillaria attramentaria]|uniref:Uncharacterized protein n=1 Tax=Batillaria attramentaria TaxID=370345 RepID=A0ABD0K4S5_9CAEN